MDSREIAAVIDHVKRMAITPEAEGLLKELQEIFRNLAFGKKGKVVAELTKWRDVNKTMELAGKVRQLRGKQGVLTQVIRVLGYLTRVAAAFA